MLRHLPLILGSLAALAALLLLGPVAVAVVLLRSSSDAVGPSLGAYIVIALLVLGLAAAAFLLAFGLGRLLLRLLRP